MKSKPYIEMKDGDVRPDEEVADELWRNHLALNDSIIADLFLVMSGLDCPYFYSPGITRITRSCFFDKLFEEYFLFVNLLKETKMFSSEVYIPISHEK